MKITGNMATKKIGRTLRSYRKHSTAGMPYVYPKNGNIPAGQYHATIDKIEPSTSSKGNPSLDIFYTLKDSQGNVYRMKQRIAEDSPYMDDFLDALADAGVDIDEVLIDDVSGVHLDIDLDYGENGFGQVTYPQSAVAVSKPSKPNSLQELFAGEEDAPDGEEA